MAWKFSLLVFIISTELFSVALSQTYCADEGFNPICGDDGRTYDNSCKMEEYNRRNDYDVGKAYHGECRDEGNYDDTYGTYKKKEGKKVVVVVHAAPAPAPYVPAPPLYVPAPAPYAPAPAPYAPVMYAPAPYAPIMLAPAAPIGIGPIMPIPVLPASVGSLPIMPMPSVVPPNVPVVPRPVFRSELEEELVPLV